MRYLIPSAELLMEYPEEHNSMLAKDFDLATSRQGIPLVFGSPPYRLEFTPTEIILWILH